MKDIIST